MNTNAILTNRENQIAELLAWGAAKKEISDRLCISTRTVENIVRNIYEKCGIQKATELCVWWFCNKYSISLDLSPIKQTIGIIVLMAFLGCNITTGTKSERYYRRARSERTCASRRKELNEFEYLIF